MIGTALLAVLVCVNFTSCSEDDDLTEYPGKNEYGLPTNIANNTIIYKTSDNVIIRFNNEDVFSGAKIIDNYYSTTKGYGTIIFNREVAAIEEDAFNSYRLGSGFNLKGNLTAIVMPASVASIGHGAFGSCESLTNVTIPNSVTSIGDFAFEDCSGLTSIEIPNSVTSIEDYAFQFCYSLTNVTIGNNVTSIGKCAFRECHNLTSIYLKAITPPITKSEVFRSVNLSNVTLYVPKGTLETYKNSSCWKNFENIQEL